MYEFRLIEINFTMTDILLQTAVALLVLLL